MVVSTFLLFFFSGKRHDDLKQSLSSQGIKPRKSSTGMKRQSLSPSQGLSRHNLSKSGTSIASTEEEAPSKHESVFSFVPKNTSDDLVEEFMESLEEKAPKIGTDGQVERQKQLMIQLPMHDIDSRACKTKLTPDEIEEMEDFHEKRQLHALGQGTVDKVAVLDTIPSAATKDDREEGEEGEEVEWSCHECKQPMKSSEVAVFAERVGPDVCWHPKCFVCSTCKELLVDLIYFCKDGEIMCGRHHAETIKPRCKACDELIFAEEYTHAEQADWHISHFCCWECDMLLGGKRYIAKEGKPYCLDCYTLKFGKKCETCGTQISADAPHLSHKDKTWHGTDECFCCFTCKKALIGKPFLPRLDHIFCSKVCYRTHQKAEMATKALE